MIDLYSFHDVTINRVTVSDNGIVLICDEGINRLSEGHITKETPSLCKIKMHITNFDSQAVFRNVIIKKEKRGKVKEIDFDAFVKLIQKHKFKVFLDYYCFVSRSIKLEGTIDSFDVTLTISDVEKIDISH